MLSPARVLHRQMGGTRALEQVALAGLRLLDAGNHLIARISDHQISLLPAKVGKPTPPDGDL